MKNSVYLFVVILLGSQLVVGDKPLPNVEAIPPANIDSLGNPAGDVQPHGKEFATATSEVASGAATPVDGAATPVDGAAAPVDGAATPVDDATATKCECAVFNTDAPTELDNPILTQAPMTMSCDFAGEQNCIKLCSALAETARESGPQLLCSILGHHDNLKASVHSRVCGAKTWTYTGLTSPNAICCHDHQLIECKDQEDNTPPANLL